jgi:hypothetical protein
MQQRKKAYETLEMKKSFKQEWYDQNLID